LSNTTVISNRAYAGGGIFTSPHLDGGSSDVKLVRSTVSHNNATFSGGGIRDTCSNGLSCLLGLVNSTVSDNNAERGAGIDTTGASAGALSIISLQDSTTINGNHASSWGGGIYTDNQIGGSKFITLTNSTISSNSAGQKGGGIYADATAQTTNKTAFLNCTIVSNTITSTIGSGSGIYAYASGSGSGRTIVTLENTIVANIPFTTNCATSGGGIITSTGHNLETGSSCGFEAMGASNLGDVDLGIGPLQDNGGDTQTHALLAGSPALDRGDLDTCLSSFVRGVDQRGITRPQGPGCDIGAFEMVVDEANGTEIYLPIVLKN
jgi:predicted outer membrane repeat protein